MTTRTPWALSSVLALASCIAHRESSPFRQVVQGDAYGFVTQSLPPPATTRVFAKGHYTTRELPDSVWIGNMAYVSMKPAPSLLELARSEGRQMRADYVLVGAKGNGGPSSLGIEAYRVLPCRLGYVQEKGTVTGVNPTIGRDIRVGDRILSIAGMPFGDRMPLLFRLKPGDQVPITVSRNGSTVDLHLVAHANPPSHLRLPESVLE